MILWPVVMDECRKQRFIGEDLFIFLRNRRQLQYWLATVGERRQWQTGLAHSIVGMRFFASQMK
ncbi:hypothetical protein AO718_16330 [Aeromonas veronii]|nr:hypothetical protein AO719_19545 [Aeromonas veronii]KRV86150.1 hypothetical protein AO718_16330 [Aeromonas veronii]KRV86551.1 hypothetical protein AO739_19430 [Aeromonas veronii]KRW09462.1 hypothetical protein AO745_19525 [Aeromonas veronii]KRW10990.1 hypothetical protein AO732_20200 [Aeromonas veronii]